jgi:hypothetical protein
MCSCFLWFEAITPLVFAGSEVEGVDEGVVPGLEGLCDRESTMSLAFAGSRGPFVISVDDAGVLGSEEPWDDGSTVLVGFAGSEVAFVGPGEDVPFASGDVWDSGRVGEVWGGGRVSVFLVGEGLVGGFGLIFD